MARRALWLVCVVAAAFALAACTRSRGSTGPESGCSDAVRSASLAVEVPDQVVLLDEALVRCRSVTELAGEMNRYPGIIGYDLTTFLELRCARTTDSAVRSSPSCATVVLPATTVPTAPDELVFVAETLDGRTIEITPDANTTFVGRVPTAIQETVDIALASGCTGLVAQRTRWEAQIGDPEIGDEASVYANHARIAADYIGCAPPTSTPGMGTIPSTTIPDTAV